MPTLDKQDCGFALVFVLWMMVLLAVIAASMIHMIRLSQAQASLEINVLSLRLLADGGVNRAILGLLRPGDEQRWRIDGSQQDVIIDGHHVDVSIRSESGKIDLNGAPASMLASVLIASGASPADATAIADRIIIWRSPIKSDSLDPSAASYFDAGRQYFPRHSAFRSVGELRMVIGMTDKIQATISPLLTVYTGSSNVDIGVAPDGVLRALVAMGNQFASAQLVARQASNAGGADRLPLIGEPLTIEARIKFSSVIADRIAIVRMIADSRQGYQVLVWK